jgi:hypothetical protein
VSDTQKVMIALVLVVFVLLWWELTKQLLQSEIVQFSLQSDRCVVD